MQKNHIDQINNRQFRLFIPIYRMQGVEISHELFFICKQILNWLNSFNFYYFIFYLFVYYFKNRHKKSTTRCNFKRENLRITTKKASFSLQKNGRGERIRTFGLMVPNHARYQAAPHPDVLTTIYNIPALKSFVKSFFENF